MEGKKTLLVGAGLLVFGLIWCYAARGLVGQLLCGLLALACAVAGALFLFMGYIEAREDRETAAKELAESAKQDAMAAKA